MTAFVANNGGSVAMCIYTITHRATGRVYVGQTKGLARRRWVMHCAPSRREKRGIVGAIKKHGKSAFSFSVIDIAETESQLDHKERFWIKELNSLAPNGFNFESGGNLQKTATQETRQAQREARAAWLASGADTSILGNGSRGRKRRPEEIAAIKIGLTGRPVSADTKERISAKQRGIPKTREYTLRMARGRMKNLVLQRSDGVVFLSYLEAEEAMKLHRSGIHAAATGKNKTAGGFTWKLVAGDGS